jgi:hypothetical protein
MSITSVSSYMSPWQWPSLRNQGTSRSGMAAACGDAMTKAGTVATNGNSGAYMQAFSADLQSMLTQMGGEASPSANSVNSAGTTSMTASAASPADPSQNPNALRGHHHRNGHGEGDDGTVDDGAHQLVGGIDGAMQDGPETADQLSKSASLFATDVTHAFESYGSVALNGSMSPGKSTVA